MSKIEVDQVDPQSGTTLTLGTSGDTVSIPSGVTLANAGTVTGIPTSALSGTIATAQIADDAVTLAKMASGTDGNIISYDASGNPVAVATGSAGQILTSAGAGSPPTFATAAAGGSLVKLAATTVSSNVANVDFTSAFTSTYSVYKIIIQGARPDTNNNAIAMRFGSGTSFDSGSNYERVVIASSVSNSNDTVAARNSTTSDISFSPMSSQSSAAETSCNMDLTIYNMLDSAKNTYVTVIGGFEGADDEFRTLLGSFNYNQTNARNSVRFFNTSGNNIAVGTFTIYGVVT